MQRETAAPATSPSLFKVHWLAFKSYFWTPICLNVEYLNGDSCKSSYMNKWIWPWYEGISGVKYNNTACIQGQPASSHTCRWTESSSALEKRRVWTVHFTVKMATALLRMQCTATSVPTTVCGSLPTLQTDPTALVRATLSVTWVFLKAGFG